MRATSTIQKTIEDAMIRRNFLADPAAAAAFIDGVKRLKDPAQSAWPGQDGHPALPDVDGAGVH